MMILHQTQTQSYKKHQSYPKVEQERIRATFKDGYTTYKEALFTLLHAIIMLTLFIIHIMTFIINFAVGTLIISHAIICMIRLLLVQLQALTENPMNTIERRER